MGFLGEAESREFRRRAEPSRERRRERGGHSPTSDEELIARRRGPLPFVKGRFVGGPPRFVVGGRDLSGGGGSAQLDRSCAGSCAGEGTSSLPGREDEVSLSSSSAGESLPLVLVEVFYEDEGKSLPLVLVEVFYEESVNEV